MAVLIGNYRYLNMIMRLVLTSYVLDIGYCLLNYAYACKFYTTEIECCSDPVEEHMKYKCNMVITNMKMLAPRCSVLLAASLIKSDY